MKVATPHALADMLRRDKPALLAAWEAKAKQLPGPADLSASVLRDDLPRLIDELADELARRGAMRERVRASSAAHGLNRQKLGAHLTVVVEEYRLLRNAIVERAEAGGLTVAGEANRALNDLIDEAVKAAIEAYIEQRDDAENRRRSEYLKFIVHDLRSPLAAIYYAIQLAEKELAQAPANERVRSIHAAVRRNIERMRGLIAKLLQEQESPKTPERRELAATRTELRPIVGSAALALAALAASNDTEVMNEVPRGVAARADPDLLGRVFQNLIANAVEHAPGGRVAVGARDTGAGRVDCWVRDNGPGIPPAVIRAAFERDAGAEARSGSGFGLAIVKRLVEAQGGTVDLESVEGKGTTVRISLPGP